MTRQLVERNDDLIGPHKPKVFTHQFISHVGIGPPRIEQVRVVPQLCALLIEACELGLPVFERAMIATPGKDSVRSSNRMTGERTDNDERQRRHCCAADQSKAPRRTPHDVIRRITKESATQVKRMIW